VDNVSVPRELLERIREFAEKRCPAGMHTCSICGFRGFWTDRWAWYGSLKDDEEGSPIIKTCSDECLSKAKVNL
jgi:hypothetical protein